MEVLYKSTRGNGETVTASQAILKGLSDDGGLFVPTSIPALDVPMEKLAAMSYQKVAYEVMSRFLTDFTEDELKNCIANAYDAKFDTEEIAPLTKADGVYYLELFHGATIAFKDMALSILPHLMTTAAKKNGVKNEIVILTATSGDTGKAAMAGFADVPGTRIIVFYPKNGVSPIQEKQMVTQKGKNTHVVAIHGNFDDAQTGVKKMFNDKELGKELADFYGNYASEQETADAIAKLYSDTGYVIDTHTAVAAAVYGKYREETYDETKTVIASTASPYKFTSSVLAAIAPEYDTLPVLEQVDKLSALANTEIPRAIEEIRTAPVLHTTECDVDQMPETVRAFLK